MKLTINPEPGPNLIRSYDTGRIRVRDEYLDCPLMLTATDRWKWAACEADKLGFEHFTKLEIANPEIIVLGCGIRRQQPSAELIAKLAGMGIGLEAMDNSAACRTYNVLVSEDRQVLLALQI